MNTVLKADQQSGDQFVATFSRKYYTCVEGFKSDKHGSLLHCGINDCTKNVTVSALGEKVTNKDSNRRALFSKGWTKDVINLAEWYYNIDCKHMKTVWMLWNFLLPWFTNGGIKLECLFVVGLSTLV